MSQQQAKSGSNTQDGGQQPPKKPAGTRSRTGCWTCRARRKKCDEKRPECTPCLNKGITCDGYGARLKWGNGVASRGYLTGKSVPVLEKGVGAMNGAAATAAAPASAPAAGGGQSAGGPRAGGGGVNGAPAATPAAARKKAKRTTASTNTTARPKDGELPPPPPGTTMMRVRMDERKETIMQKERMNSLDFGSVPNRTKNDVRPARTAAPAGLSAFDEMLFREFQEWGSFYVLVSADTSKPSYDVLSLCAQSKSLLANCLMFQLSLHPEHEDKFEKYYAESLRLFTKDVSEAKDVVKDATLVAGIMLCSIGMMRGMIWTIHLTGLYSILQFRDAVTNPTALTSDIVDTIGFLDLPTHIVGRQTKPLNIWRDYCRGKEGLESVSGLPHGLLDLLSNISHPDIEMQFWTWTGAGLAAKPIQRRAWDAIRVAGIISAREYQRQQQQQQPFTSNHVHNPHDRRPSSGNSCPRTDTLVQAIIDCLRDFLRTPRDEAIPVLNLFLYPTFMAGTQCDLLSPPHKAVIEDFFKGSMLEEEAGDTGGGLGAPHLEAPLDVLRELWTNRKGRTADQVAKEWKIEIGLF